MGKKNVVGCLITFFCYPRASVPVSLFVPPAAGSNQQKAHYGSQRYPGNYFSDLFHVHIFPSKSQKAYQFSELEKKQGFLHTGVQKL